MKNKSKTVVITGAESTGKSAITEQLSCHFKVPYIPEFARDYIENLGQRYKYTDVETIARMQIKQFNEYKQLGQWLFFSDTWLIITKIWFEEVFNKVPFWLEMEIKNAEIDLFLICDIDLPWVPDNVRENGGEKREYLQKRYINSIKEYKFPFEIISGINSSRFHNAVSCLERYGIIKPNKV